MIRRNTSQKQIVFSALEILGHATSEELIEWINSKYENISLATIYRNLTVLLEDEIIKKVKVGKVDVYETKKAKHYHYQCTKCGSIIDILPSELPYSLDIKKVHNENVCECDLVLYGTCHNCKNNL